jgi:hypothetical protein
MKMNQRYPAKNHHLLNPRPVRNLLLKSLLPARNLRLKNPLREMVMVMAREVTMTIWSIGGKRFLAMNGEGGSKTITNLVGGF